MIDETAGSRPATMNGLVKLPGGSDVSADAGADLMTVAEVAARLRVGLRTIYSLCESGELACYRIGSERGTIRITWDDVEQYLSRVRSGRAARAKREKVPELKAGEHIR